MKGMLVLRVVMGLFWVFCMYVGELLKFMNMYMRVYCLWIYLW